MKTRISVLKFFTFEIVYFSTITDQIQIELKVLTDKINFLALRCALIFKLPTNKKARF